MADPQAGLTARLTGLNPFKSKRSSGSGKYHKHHKSVDDEDKGELLDPSAGSIAGGGHSARPSEIAHQHALRVSNALQSLLVHEGALSNLHPDTLHALQDKPHIVIPDHVTDRSHPLPNYFISSSHNTYLLAHQLFGTSCATAYQTALNAGSRCVEIDAWDNPDNLEEPKVTHGYTLVSNIPFRVVCETIRDVIDKEAIEGTGDATPILLSLENHCSAAGQLRLVQIMEEVLGDHLLSSPIYDGEGDDTDAHVLLEELGSKVVVIVEYQLANEAVDTDSSSSSSSDSSSDEEEKAREQYKEKKKTNASGNIIIPELAALGLYAQSVKPADGSWYLSPMTLRDEAGYPHHHLINISESGLAPQFVNSAQNAELIIHHNSRHLMRVFPKGTRISSRNLKPLAFWGVGAQICALNWQTFDASMQLNEAMFAGTDGFVLKPGPLRGEGAVEPRKKKLRLRVAGATGIPLPEGREHGDLKPYLTCTFMRPATGENGVQKTKRKTSAYKRHKALSVLQHLVGVAEHENPVETDPVWDETLEWEYEDDGKELEFLRMMIKSDDTFAANPVLCVAAVRLLYVVKGEWRFIRMLDLKGRETGCTLLARFDVEDV